eukprot:1758569-Rhodomonas_salina.1
MPDHGFGGHRVIWRRSDDGIRRQDVNPASDAPHAPVFRRPPTLPPTRSSCRGFCTARTSTSTPKVGYQSLSVVVRVRLRMRFLRPGGRFRCAVCDGEER